jgi:hypothetical protein
MNAPEKLPILLFEQARSRSQVARWKRSKVCGAISSETASQD